ncbi:4-alpha-glucanotransferase dpe2 [Datura stramonium]|uniref:4-alpha-glucanotransferase dpe2 n=1 Tax=Datura stramonium TaxID=4076 RepID=A0ABS8WV19_DATST|nr:4-alpha-glucanotransferase dpe2 [Datura stramonium]
MESLLDDKDLTKTIKDLVRGSGRFYPQKDMESGQATGEGSAKLQLGSELPSLTQTNGLPKKEAVAFCLKWNQWRRVKKNEAKDQALLSRTYSRCCASYNF